MQLTVFGATGPTGQALVRLALQRGHDVVAYTRRDGVFGADPDPSLTVIRGELDDREAVAKAISGSSVVVNVLGPTKKDPGNPVITEATRLIADTAIDEGVRRHLVVTAWGVGARRAETPWFFRAILLNTILKKSFGVKTDQEAVLAEARYVDGLDLTIVGPGQLTKGTDAAYRAADSGRDISSKVSRVGLATFLLDSAEDGSWLRTSVVIGS